MSQKQTALVTGGSGFSGGNNEQKNLSLVNQICSILDNGAPPVEVQQLYEQGLKSYKELIRFVTDRLGHDQRYAIDSAKIRRESGWQVAMFIEAIQQRQGLMISCPEEIAYHMGYITKDQLEN